MIVVGGLLLAVSFALPLHFYDAPLAWFLWAVGGIDFRAAPAASLAFMAAAAGVALPYIWALVLAVVHVRRGWTESVRARQSLLRAYVAGMAMLALAGLAEILARDTFVPREAQVLTTVIALLIAAGMLAADRALPPARRLHACAAIGALPLALLSLGLGLGVCRGLANGWGYFLGASGGLLVAAGAARSLCSKSGSAARNPAERTNV